MATGENAVEVAELGSDVLSSDSQSIAEPSGIVERSACVQCCLRARMSYAYDVVRQRASTLTVIGL